MAEQIKQLTEEKRELERKLAYKNLDQVKNPTKPPEPHMANIIYDEGGWSCSARPAKRSPITPAKSNLAESATGIGSNTLMATTSSRKDYNPP